MEKAALSGVRSDGWRLGQFVGNFMGRFMGRRSSASGVTEISWASPGDATNQCAIISIHDSRTRAELSGISFFWAKF